jgi:hypothetical protein
LWSDRLTKWSGPILIVLGALCVAIIAALDLRSRSTLTQWVLTSALRIERVLPLIALGAAFSMINWRQFLYAACFFILGMVLGSQMQGWFMSVIVAVPRAPEHTFMTGPISCLATGLLLLFPDRLRPMIAVPVATVAGAMLVIAIKATDPSWHKATICCVGILAGCWIVAAVSLTAKAFYQQWFPIAGRILGSWLLAIGCLYGSASFVARPALPPAPPREDQAPPADFDRLFPDFDRPHPEAVPETKPPQRGSDSP